MQDESALDFPTSNISISKKFSTFLQTNHSWISHIKEGKYGNDNKKIINNFYFDKPKNQTSSGDDPLQISLSTSIIRLSASGLRPSADNQIISVDNDIFRG